MSRVRIELNRQGVKSMLKSSEMRDMLQEKANEIAGRAGDEYETDVKYMSTRVISSVYTTDHDADHNDLLRALR